MIFKHKGLSIYYEKYGNKNNNILILPGWGNTRGTFNSIINYFQTDYSIYIIDYPGFGNSSMPKKELTMFDYAELIDNFIKKLNINNLIIIAHSFGGRIASLLLSNHNIKVKKLILTDVAGIKRKNIKVFLKRKIYKLLKFIISFLPVKYKKYYIKKLLCLFASDDYQNLHNDMKKTFQNIVSLDLKDNYKKIDVETLIIWGEKDLDTPLKDGYYLLKHIKNSALIVYPNATHYSYLQYPFLTNSIIEKYLNTK